MVLKLVLIFAISSKMAVALASATADNQNAAYYYYDDDYYYDDQYEDSRRVVNQESKVQAETAGPGGTGSGFGATSSGSGVGSEDYDLAELVKAWKAYISEKSESSSPQRGGGGGSGGRRRGQHQQRRRFRTTPPPPVYECPPRDASYRVGDETQCDKFIECNIKGEKAEMLCPDGLVFDLAAEHCDYPAKVNCSGRPNLQEPQPTKNCPRANGFFPFPANESCQKFWDCREGKSYLQSCPAAVIFDPHIDACTTPDQSNRPECAAGKFLGFECPQYGPEEILRFGNHDRLPHPDNCQQFFSCLRNGHPRLGACPKKTVFSPETGHCAEPEKVKGCETYWSEKEKEEDFYDYY